MQSFIYVALLTLTFCLSASSLSSSVQVNDVRSSSSTNLQQRKAVVIGGGPAGLAAALALSSEPHNFHVTVVETSSRNSTRTFDASKAYLYNINARGQKFTKKFDAVYKRVDELGVEQVGMRFKSFTLVPGDTKVS